MSFTADLSRFVTNAEGSIDSIVRNVVLRLGREVVERSPVGDASYWREPAPAGYVGGRFRANWQHGVDVLPQGTFDTTDNVSVQRILSTIPHDAAGKVHYLTNNVPYSIALENGHSRQAPQGVVGLTVARFDEYIREEAAQL